MTRANRIWLVIPWAAFAAIVVAWIFYWFAVAGAAEQKLAAWSAEQRQAGGEVAYGQIIRHGFPVLMRLEVSDFHFKPARAAWKTSTLRFDLNVEMLNPGHVILEAKAPVLFENAEGAISTLNAQRLIASVRMNGAVLAQAGVESNLLTLVDSAKPGVLRVGHLVVNVRPDPRQAGHYQLAFEGGAITLARPVRSFEPFGQEIQSLRAGIVIEQAAALLRSAPDDPLRPWREAGGKARIEALNLHWGALEASGTGQMALDDQRRLLGDARLQLPHPAPALTALAQSDNLTHDTKQALNVLALGYSFSGRHVSFDVSAHDGALKVENVPVRVLAPLY